MKKTLLLSLLALAACGGDDDKHSDAAVADLSASGPDMLTLDTVTPREFDGPADGGGSMGSPLTVEATACWAQHPEIACATGNGTLSIPFPAAPSATSGELDFALLVAADGHLGSTRLQRLTTGAGEVGGTAYLYTDAYAGKLFTSAGFTYPSSTGFIDGAAYSGDSELSGFTVSITPASGKVVYYDTDGTPNPSLTASTGNGFMIGNVTPGAFTLTFSAPGKTCSNPATLFGTGAFPSNTPQSVGGYVGPNSIVAGLSIECD